VSGSSSVFQTTSALGDLSLRMVSATKRPSGAIAGSPVDRTRRCTRMPSVSCCCRSARAISTASAVSSTVNLPYSSDGDPPYSPANADSNERSVFAVMRRHSATTLESPSRRASHSMNADPAR
jgi:hypothetical protein